ncbi:MAG: (2Fe-2S)-binding protein [Rhodospirillaceae bacterium]|nr:(2Fe-2S)-binding protein [Rhodospirillaceae bacterium]
MTDSSITYRLRVNGETEDVTAPAGETLIGVLRERLQLTGAKLGCAQGVCGTCTVLLDGRPTRGCLTLAADCTDREITTIEGLGVDGGLSAVQSAFVAAGAIQCGFCTAGMILTITALLKRNPRPSEAEVRHGISGNLCRCSGYTKIVEAALLAAGSAA